MDISPDGQTLAFAMDDSLMFWNLVTLKSTGSISTKLHGKIFSIDYSGRGDKIAAGGSDSSVVIVDLSNQNSILRFKGAQGVITSVKFSPDDTFLAAGCSDHCIYIWQMDNTEKVIKLEGHQKDVTDIEFLNNNYLAGCDGEGKILIWNLIKKQVESNLTAHKGWARDLSLNHDNQQLVSCGDDALVKNWKIGKHYFPELVSSEKLGLDWLNCIDLYGSDFIGSISLNRKVYVDTKNGLYTYKTNAFAYKILFIPETIPFKIIYCTLDDGIFLLEAENMNLKQH
ncbi:MAG: WD repeat-containing [Bacteroidetes bacterium]|nr:MAG: WD repeat-containing [Bacteroidota bacterium]